MAFVKDSRKNLLCLMQDMFVLVTEDGMECKSEDDKRWNGSRSQSYQSIGVIFFLNGLLHYSPLSKLGH